MADTSVITKEDVEEEFGKKCEEWVRNNVIDEEGRHFIPVSYTHLTLPTSDLV